jgi:hypothetical protein
MWKIRIFYVLLSLIVIGIVKESVWTKPRFKLDEKARGKFAELPGQIKAEFVGSDKYWHYSIVNGELLLRTVKDFPPAHLEKRPYIDFAKDVPNGLPKIEGLEYYGPYRLSPDKSLMFLSLSSEGGYVPKDFAVIQMEEKELLFQRKNNHKIEDVAWSPDSNMFAVLSQSFRIHLGISGIFAFMVAHPVLVCKYYLSIYDRRGNLLITAEVASGLIGGGGQVSWGKPEGM